MDDLDQLYQFPPHPSRIWEINVDYILDRCFVFVFENSLKVYLRYLTAYRCNLWKLWKPVHFVGLFKMHISNKTNFPRWKFTKTQFGSTALSFSNFLSLSSIFRSRISFVFFSYLYWRLTVLNERTYVNCFVAVLKVVRFDCFRSGRAVFVLGRFGCYSNREMMLFFRSSPFWHQN